jgi:GNAT superfamily N-acetyltransferase
MSPPGDTAETVRLHDGSVIRVRQVQPGDKGAIATGFERLSPESRYRRFFSPLKHLTETDLRYLTEVDHHDHEALIATSAEGEPIGVARYVGGERPDEAEVAVAIVDDWQGRGAATVLLERLVERARANGIERFVAVILQENTDAVELFRSLSGGAAKPRRTEAGHLELVLDLPTGGVSGSMLGRALRGAASGKVVIHPWRLLKHRLQQGQPSKPEGENRPDR